MLLNKSTEIVTRGVNVTDYVIGSFGDDRLLKVGALLFKKITNKFKSSIKKLADNRAEEMAFNRFLLNSKTKETEMETTLSNSTNSLCFDKKHVLAITDTVEVNYSSQPKKKLI